MYRDLTQNELDALNAFAAAHKRKADRTPGCNSWQDELSMVYWYNARIWRDGQTGAAQYGNTLHALRNEFGPSWLYDVCPVR